MEIIKDKKIIVTGGAGFIGSNLVENAQHKSFFKRKNGPF